MRGWSILLTGLLLGGLLAPGAARAQGAGPVAQVRAELEGRGYTVRLVGTSTDGAVVGVYMDMVSAQFDDAVRRQIVAGWYALSLAYTDAQVATYLSGLVYQERYILCFMVAPADFDDWLHARISSDEFNNKYIVKVLDRQTGQWVTDKDFIAKNFGGGTGTTQPTAQPSGTVPPLTQSICCGQTFGGTRIWSVRVPAGWQVQYIPNDPNNFVAVIVSDPQSTIKLGFFPSLGTDPGSATDQARDVDEFLDAVRADYTRDHPDFEEALRQPVTGLADIGRIWAGHWGAGDEQTWTSFLVLFTPLPYVAPGVSRGSFTMQGVEAAASEWNQATAIYEAVLGTMQAKLAGGGYTAPTGGGTGWLPPSVKPMMLRWCPRCCDWQPVTADRYNWECPVCGTPTELWEVPCIGTEQ